MSDGRVTIRMFNVGFGDCFLLTIPARDRPRKVLVDCGKHPSGPKRDMKKVVADVIQAVSDGGEPRIDVVVATHRHRDHVSGFEDGRWKTVQVHEVWLPWTEDPKDQEARRILERQSSTARLMLAAFGARAGGSFTALLNNSLKNAQAMQTLHEGFKERALRRFLSTGSPQEPLVTPVLPGVRVHVLGPSRDPEVIRDLDPPEGKHYLTQLEAADPGVLQSGSWQPPRPAPFADRWRLGEEIDVESAYGRAPLRPDEATTLRNLDSFDPLAIAVSLDKAVNGTSLMLLFQIGPLNLLFPGDAEWGSWQAAMESDGHRELLKQTTFYKVSHHGSYNGTPRPFVEEMLSPNAWAMVSTGHVDQWPLIPKDELMTALAGKDRLIVRSDLEPAADHPGMVWTEDYTEISLPV